jgi:hypothetical protein
MPETTNVIRDFIYLDIERVQSLAAQLRTSPGGAGEETSDRAAREQMFINLEPALPARANSATVGSEFDFSRWTAENFFDGQFVLATGIVRLLDFSWLTIALGGLPAVLRKLVGSAYNQYFYDSPAALSQKYGIEIDAGWTVIGQLNVPTQAPPPQPIPVGNQMEDSFEQIALLMNNAFKLANAPAFPALSLTPIAIYRNVR